MRIRGITLFFVVYVVALSFVPLIHQTFVAQSAWLGYGEGAYAFQAPSYFILFNDPSDGSSKPNIHINPPFAPNERISLVEFSDWTSYVNGYNLFNDFNASIHILSPKVLEVDYSRPGIAIQKFVDASSPDHVSVKMLANKEITAHIEMWKWLMTSINGVTIQDAPKPTVLPQSSTINFTFQDQATGTPGSGLIKLSRLATQIEIWPFKTGFNRVTADYINSEMEFTVQGSASGNQQSFPIWNYADLPYVLPLIAIAVVAVYLLLVEKHGKENKGRTGRPRS